MFNFDGLTGQKFGKLTVEKTYRENAVVWCDCNCDCGGFKKLKSRALKDGKTKSCGCLRNRVYSNRSQEICKVEGCENTQSSVGYCTKHYAQYRKNGEIIKTRFDKNKIIQHDNYAEIIMEDKNQEETCRAMIDLEDVEKIENYKWCKRNNDYIGMTSEDGKTILLHRFILTVNEDEYVDHINRNRIDNRKENLRIVEMLENNINHNICSTNTSGITGVAWITKSNKWKAYIGKDNKTINLGLYENKDDAILARLKGEEKYNYKGANLIMREEYKMKGLI